MVILELEDEINILNAKRTDKDKLDMLSINLTEIREEVKVWLEAQITHMRNRKLDYYEDLVDSELEELDNEMRSIRKVIALNEDKATECLKEIKRLEGELDSSYNEMWVVYLSREGANQDLVIKLKILYVYIQQELRTSRITQLLSTLEFLMTQWHMRDMQINAALK